MNITFRSQLLESVADFCKGIALDMATPELMVDLIFRLARYQEEGRNLAPQVYLTDGIDSLISMMPGSEKLLFSNTKSNSAGIEEMLKTCAPLATSDWLIFGHQCEEGMNFGLFRGAGNPTSTHVDETVLKDQDKAAVIKAHQITAECVQIRNSKGCNHSIFFDDREDGSPPPLQDIEKFVGSIIEKVNANEQQSVQSFLLKSISTALYNSHGCILAVTNLPRPPKFLSKDAIIVDDPIDFPSLIKDSKNGPESLFSLEKKSKLLEGMICSDGITLFDQRGRLLGYRCFVNLSAKKESKSVIGGARRRAYEALKQRRRSGLSAAFMQSQDGRTDFEDIGR